MARLEGGIFSRPRGKTGGVVFGAARTREGKAVTSRLLVRPSNPRTPAQQLQRRKFDRTLNTVRSWGPGLYQNFFNRTIGQLAGFQSLESILLSAFKNDGSFEAPADTRTGSAFGWSSGDIDFCMTAMNTVTLNWFNNNADYPVGTKFHIFMVYTENGDWQPEDEISREYIVHELTQATDEPSRDIIVPTGEDQQFLLGTFVEHVANSPSPISMTQWYTGYHGDVREMKNNG